MKNKINTRCGLFSIIGFPNAGKSTLINSLIKKKISIISHKAQTTNTAIKGILNLKKNQIILIDTPGLLSPKSYLNKKMTRSIYHSSIDSDFNLLVHDVRKTINLIEKKNLERLLNKKKNFLIVNKIDLVDKETLLNTVKNISSMFNFEKIFMVSAIKSKGLTELKESIIKFLPERDWLYKNDQLI